MSAPLPADDPLPVEPIGPTVGRAFPTPPMYGSRSADTPLVNLAFLGRVSDEELQDPTLSIPRQLANCQAVLPPGARIVAHYWDVESGRIDPDRRGRGKAHERFAVPVPRDGGIRDLLDTASASRRCFDAVICESIDRVARRTYYGVKIEHDLERVGLALLASDEGITNLRKRATAILTRRVKQATSEWYVLDTLEKAWDGFCEHATQGWNIGVPPYGYLADRVPHPVPAKRADGLCKTRLVLDPVRAPVIEAMFTWRVTERLSCQAIADRLDADPDRYPPPTAIGGTRTRGSWSARSARALLLNPKYTGYMVWNRRARNTKRGRHNPPELWVWSKEPSHPAIVSLDTYRAAAAVAELRHTSRSASTPNNHPATKRTYLLRSYVYCALCTRRMEGTTRKGTFAYFRCRPRPTSGHDARHRWPGHPADIYVPQDKLLAGILDFFADRVFSDHRRELLAADLDRNTDDASIAWQERVAAIERTIADLDARRGRLLQALETTDDPNGVLAQDVNRRLIEIARQQHTKIGELQQHRSHPPQTNTDATELLNQIGRLTHAQLEAAPEPVLRGMFDAFALTVHYDPTDRLATCQVILDDGTVPTVASAVTAIDGRPTGVGSGISASPSGPDGELGIYVARSEGLEPPTLGLEEGRPESSQCCHVLPGAVLSGLMGVSSSISSALWASVLSCPAPSVCKMFAGHASTRPRGCPTLPVLRADWAGVGAGESRPPPF